jgi:hypothetical protein
MFRVLLILRITTLPIQESTLDIAQITQWSQQTEWLTAGD